MAAIPVEASGPRTRGRPARSVEQRAEQRARLLDGVMTAVRRHGPDASIDLMAAGAKVSKPVLYDEFGDKRGIVDAVAVAMAERFERELYVAVTEAPGIDLDAVVRVAIGALMTLIDSEPQLYSFLARAMHSSDRGFLDNVLVGVLRDRAEVIVRVVAPTLDADAAAVLTDGLFGFVFAAVESWQVRRRPEREELVEQIALVLTQAFRTVADSAT